MKTFQLSNGNMPVLGLGTWKSEPGDVYQAVKEAIKIGYRHIDCAFIYGNEAEVGKALAESFEAGTVKRADMWVTSKLWGNAHAPEDVKPALENTLKDLQLDYLDLYLVHWPVPLVKEKMMPEAPSDFVSPNDLSITDTWQAMETMVDQGLTRNIGVSNFGVARLQATLDQARIKPVVNQIELHPYLQQADMLEFCQKNNVFLTAYSPLGSKDRPAHFKPENEPVLLDDPVIAAIAQNHQVSPAQVLIGWAVQRGTSVIPKSVNPGRMKQNLDAADIALTAEDMEKITALDRSRRYIDGTFWTSEGSPHTLESLWK